MNKKLPFGFMYYALYNETTGAGHIMFGVVRFIVVKIHLQELHSFDLSLQISLFFNIFSFIVLQVNSLPRHKAQ